MTEKLKPCMGCVGPGECDAWPCEDEQDRDAEATLTAELPRRAQTTIEEALSVPEVRALVEWATTGDASPNLAAVLAPFLAALAAEKEAGR
jgi:hypothetical protein